MGVAECYQITDVSFQDNERSFVIQLISEINNYIQDRQISIKRAGGERTINGGHFVKFPDVLLFSDRQQSVILQGWEAKCPDVPIDDPAFVADARNKAKLLNCNSTVLWNFQYAQLHVCNDDGEFEIMEKWTISDNIVDRASISLYENEWVDFLHHLVDKIAEYIATGSIKHRSLGDALTGNVMPMLINQNKGHLADNLKHAAARDVRISTFINSWWQTVKQEYAHDENDPFSAYAKIILVNWMNKLLFANIIQGRYDEARVVNDITEGCKIQEAIDYFEYITSKCGFYNVFSQLEYADLLPAATWDDIVSFNQLLLECDIAELESEYSHRILEDGISVTKRQIAGQYPTPEPLARLMSEIAVRDAYGNAWDCCCGTGTIGCSIWKRKVEMLAGVESHPEEVAYRTTWLSDIHDFPLQIATQSISSLYPTAMPLLVFQQNVFDVGVDKALGVIDPSTGKRLEVSVPKYKAITSNLPFVDFNTSEISWYDEIKESIKHKLLEEHGISLSDRNDLYCYIALHLKEMLAEDGCVVLLTSNSWLCTSAGDDFVKALRAVFSVDGIYVNGKHRWFTNADVMNALIVLKHPKSGQRDFVNMGVISASVADMENDEIRHAISAAIIMHAPCSEPLFRETAITWEGIDAMKGKGMSYYSMCHDISFMSKVFPKLRKAGDMFSVARGTKSGQDSFFYSTDANFVEEEFRYSLLKNLKKAKTFELKPDGYAFKCSMSVEELSSKGFVKALTHIRSVSSINQSCRSHRPYWYTLPMGNDFEFATMMNPGSRLFFAYVPEGLRFVANQRAICFSAKTQIDKELLLALLNSTLGMFLIEASAAPMALGALDTKSETFSAMYMLDPDSISKEQRDQIVEAFEPLKSRSIKDALDELEMNDRKSFDAVLMKAFGLSEVYDDVVLALQGMLCARLKV